MEEIKFKIKKALRSGNAEVDKYITLMEEYLLDFDTSNIKKLIRSLDKIAGVIAEDIDMIIEGTDWEPAAFEPAPAENGEESEGMVCTDPGHSRLKVLSDSKDSKVFERVMTLFAKVKDLDAVSKTAKGLVPEVEEIKEVKGDEEYREAVKLSGLGNSFEEAQGKQFKKRSGKNIV